MNDHISGLMWKHQLRNRWINLNDQGDRYTCDFCSKKFNHKMDVYRHMKYRCKIKKRRTIDKQIKKFTNRKKHIKS
jgi:hypothetical protein